jgi:hypothetical protein
VLGSAPGVAMSDTIVRIRRIDNGFVVCANDPKIMENNRKPKVPWKDPECEYAFDTFEKVLKWLKTNVDNLVPEPDDADEYANSFDEATAEERK